MAEVSVFDPASNTLIIPTLQVGSTQYANARLLLPVVGQWSVVSVGTASFSATATGCATPSTGTPVAMSISPASIEAGPGETVVFGIGGGTPPYRAISARSNVATVIKIEQDICSASAAVYLLAQGVGSSDIIVYDNAGNKVAATVKQAGKAVVPFAVSPIGVTAVAGESVRINIVGGWPPYRVSSSRAFVAWADSGSYNSDALWGDAPHAEATIRTRSPGAVTITVSDQGGSQQAVTITVLDKAS